MLSELSAAPGWCTCEYSRYRARCRRLIGRRPRKEASRAQRSNWFPERLKSRGESLRVAMSRADRGARPANGSRSLVSRTAAGHVWVGPGHGRGRMEERNRRQEPAAGRRPACPPGARARSLLEAIAHNQFEGPAHGLPGRNGSFSAACCGGWGGHGGHGPCVQCVLSRCGAGRHRP